MKLTATAAATVLCLCASWAQANTPTNPPKKARKAAPPVATLAQASPEQLAAAERALIGPYECEFKQSIEVGSNPKSPGYVDVKHKKATYTMRPVQSSTGALRLEDVKGKTLWLQIANKSMLMDVKAGQRIVDGCVHAGQREAAIAAAAK